jgi:hypothetical protein
VLVVTSTVFEFLAFLYGAPEIFIFDKLYLISIFMFLPTLTIKTDPNFEFKKIKDSLKSIDIFLQQGYLVDLPKIDLDKLKDISDQDLYNIVGNEHDEQTYLAYKKQLEDTWSQYVETIFSTLNNLVGVEIQTEYIVYLTKYGPGGGNYGYPNDVAIKLYYGRERTAMGVLIHEIIHLSVHNLIEKYQIEHWTKERLVDLISLKIFPGKFKLQRDPENSEMVSKYFDQYYPNMKKIISSISNREI